jgi:hypothetical protein
VKHVVKKIVVLPNLPECISPVVLPLDLLRELYTPNILLLRDNHAYMPLSLALAIARMRRFMSRI